MKTPGFSIKIDQLPGRTRVFLDANVFLYHLVDASPGCSRVLALVENQALRGFTSLPVLEEVLFRRLVRAAVIQFGWSWRGAVENLRLHPELAKKLLSPWQEVKALSSLLTVIEPTLSDLFRSQEIQESYGLFGNDALTAVLIARAGIEYIATTDRDFDRLDFAQRVEVESG